MPDYMFLLESRLSPEQRAAMMRVQELSAALGCNVYLTGGTVRDLVTGASLRDLDFTVEGNPSKIARELEKGGAKILSEDEKLRQVEVLFAGDCEGSISASRDDHYVRPGTRPEIRWSTIMEDLRRRDFSLNSIAISLNPASRGLLLDPTNGLSDIERDLQRTIEAEDAGSELRAVAREERPSVVLKAWEEHDLLEAVSPVLAKKHPDYEAVSRLMKVREDLFTAGFRPRLATPMLLAILGRLKDREQASVLAKAGFRSAEADAVLSFEQEAREAQKELVGRKMNAPIDAYRFLEKLPLEQMAYLMAESNNSTALSKIRAYLNKWRPLRISLPAVANELETLGMPRGPKFDQIMDQIFAMQLTGRGKTREEREKILRKLSGIKEQPKKKEKEKKPSKAADKAHAAAAVGAAARQKHAAAKADAKHAAKGKSVSPKAPAKHAAPMSHGRSSSSGKKSHGRK